MLPALILGAGLVTLQSGALKGTDILDILSGLHDPIRDVSFHWEGRLVFVRIAESEDSSIRSATFTGTCAYRRTDGALWYELFKTYSEEPLSIERRAFFGGEQRVVHQTPDRGQSSAELSTHTAWPDGCVGQSLFGQIFYVPYFDNLTHGGSHEIEFRGYE
jgi:hypothetical protein